MGNCACNQETSEVFDVLYPNLVIKDINSLKRNTITGCKKGKWICIKNTNEVYCHHINDIQFKGNWAKRISIPVYQNSIFITVSSSADIEEKTPLLDKSSVSFEFKGSLRLFCLKCSIREDEAGRITGLYFVL